MDGFPFRLLVPTADDIRPSSPLGVELPGQTGQTVLLPPAADVADGEEFARWLDAFCAERSESDTDAFDVEASQGTRDDGSLYHDRLPCEDIEPFNPHIIARAEVWPGEMDDAIEGAQMPAESWMGMRGGAA